MILLYLAIASFYQSILANTITSNLSTCDATYYEHTGARREVRRTVLRDGIHIIQGILPLSSTRDNCNTILLNGLLSMLAFRFAMENLKDMPFNGSSLGYHIDDSCNSIPSIMSVAIEIVNQYRNESVCNIRSCGSEMKRVKPVIAVVGPYQSFTSIPFASLLGLQNIPIVSPSASSRLLSKKDLYKSFSRIIPSDVVQARVIAELLQRFNWKYIYVIGSDDNYGKLGISILKGYTEEYQFCIVADDYIPYATADMKSKANEIVNVIAQNGNAQVVVIFAYNIQIELILSEAERRNLRRVWVLSDAFQLTGEGSLSHIEKQITGVFKVAPKSKRIDGFQTFLENEVRNKPHCNLFLRLFMEQNFKCQFNETSVFCPNDTAESIVKNFLEVDSSLIGNTIDAMNAIATALKGYYAENCNITKHGLLCPRDIDIRILTKHVLNVSFTNVYGDPFEFDSNGDPKNPSYDIGNVQNVGGKLRITRIGTWDPRSRLNIDLSRVIWPYWAKNVTPKSSCSDDCSPGYYVAARTECCWSCEQCLLNTISTVLNAKNCSKCQHGFISNEERTKCVQYKYISLQPDDVAGIVIIVVNTLGIIVSILIFMAYRYYRRSMVIKVHNRMPHILYLSVAQLILSFAYGEVILMKRSSSYCSIVMGSMSVLRTGFAVLILSRTRIFLSLIQKFIIPYTGSYTKLAHLLVLSLFIVIHIVLTIPCGVYDPVPIETQPLEAETSLAINCNFNYTPLQAVTFLVYPNLVLFVATVAAIRERSEQHSYSEAKFLNFAAIANCIVSVAFFPTYKYVVGIYKTIVMAFTMDVCAFTYIGCLMLPHLYMARSDKLRVSSPKDHVSTESSLAETNRAKYRTSLQEIKEEHHSRTISETRFGDHLAQADVMICN